MPFSIRTPEQREHKRLYSRERARQSRLDPAFRAADVERHKRYYEANPEARARRNAQCRARQAERRAKEVRPLPLPLSPAARLAILEKRLATRRAWWLRNKKPSTEAQKANKKAWREANRDRQRANIERWNAAHPEQRIAEKHRYRARLRGSTEHHSAAEIKTLKEMCGGRCAHCLKKARLTIDHIVALANGGSNAIRNIQFLCSACNSYKRDLDPIEFARTAGRLC